MSMQPPWMTCSGPSIDVRDFSDQLPKLSRAPESAQRLQLGHGSARLEFETVPVEEVQMLSEADRKTIVEVSARYNAKRVLLFGSCTDPGKKNRDIDIAVDGVPPRDFFSFYGDLILALSKPVDVVDLTVASKFTELIRQEGVLLYG